MYRLLGTVALLALMALWRATPATTVLAGHGPVCPTPQPTKMTVCGKWQFNYYGGDRSGLPTIKPVRYARVDLVKPSGTSFATTFIPDGSGNFEIRDVNPPEEPPGTPVTWRVEVRSYALVKDTADPPIRGDTKQYVTKPRIPLPPYPTHPRGDPDLESYVFTSLVEGSAGPGIKDVGVLTIPPTSSYPDAVAFSIVEEFIEGRLDPDAPPPLPLVTTGDTAAVWAPSWGDPVSGYVPGTDRGRYQEAFGVIYLDGNAVDDTAWHEQGHSVMHHVYGFVPTSDQGWLEGWPIYWSAAVPNDSMVDSSDVGIVDLETYLPAEPPSGDANKWRVGASVWDIFDIDIDSGPGISNIDAFWAGISGGYSFRAVWDVFAMAFPLNGRFPDYWVNWKISPNSECAVTSIYQNTISYNASSWERCANAQLSLTSSLDGNEYVRVPVTITQLKDLLDTAQVQAPGGISAFDNKVTYPPAGINVVKVDWPGYWSSKTSSINNAAGYTTFNGTGAGFQPSPSLVIAYVYPRLVGCTDASYTLTLPNNDPPAPYSYKDTGTGTAAPNNIVKTYRRGDAKADGAITSADVLIIAQYLAGWRQIGEGTGQVHPVNAASARPDGGNGDWITGHDLLYIAQKLVGIRDKCFIVIGFTSQGTQTGNATVEVGSVTLQPGQQAQIPITIRGINDPDGLGGYDFKITFDPTVVNIIAIGGGQAPFDGSPSQNRDNVNGVVRFNATQSAIPGPTGDIIVDYLTVQAVGSSGASTTLNLSITSLFDSFGDDISARDQDGTVTIQ